MSIRRMLVLSASFAAVGMAISGPLAYAAPHVARGAQLVQVTPLDATGCSGVLGSDQIENCVYVVGSASDLVDLSGDAYTHFGTAYGHEEITGPSVPGGYMNSSNQTITTTDSGWLVRWQPNHSVTAGNYCSTFWKSVSGGYTAIGPDCEYVS